MLAKCLLVGAVLVMMAMAEDQRTVRRLRTAEPGNWTVKNCIVVKMSAQVKAATSGFCSSLNAYAIYSPHLNSGFWFGLKSISPLSCSKKIYFPPSP
jgi:hypothetical protein